MQTTHEIAKSISGSAGTFPEIVPIAGAAAVVAKITGGVRPNRSTLERWFRRGSRGHRLETRLVGSRRYVRVDELRRFLDAIASDDAKALAGAVA